jgi:HAMP domain-containing protein
MGLRLKFNLVMLLVAALGLTGIGFIASAVLQRNAREEILHTAGLMMESALAIRGYTVNQIRPLLSVQMTRDFLPQTVPAYAATENIRGLRKRYPDFTYKEATLNPTNPASRATEWEAGIVEYFRNHKDAKQLVGEHATPTGRSLYLARPIEVKSEGCLSCHGSVADAPPTMLARYGKANGFGWKMREIVGSQIVSVPMSVSLARADKTLVTFMLAVGAVFAVVMLILNLLLHSIVIHPVKRMASIAHDVSMGKLDVEECKAKGKDEISVLAESFNRMRRSLVNAMEMLNTPR